MVLGQQLIVLVTRFLAVTLHIVELHPGDQTIQTVDFTYLLLILGLQLSYRGIQSHNLCLLSLDLSLHGILQLVVHSLAVHTNILWADEVLLYGLLVSGLVGHLHGEMC